MVNCILNSGCSGHMSCTSYIIDHRVFCLSFTIDVMQINVVTHCIYIYIFTYTHVCIYVHVYIYIYIYTLSSIIDQIQLYLYLFQSYDLHAQWNHHTHHHIFTYIYIYIYLLIYFYFSIYTHVPLLSSGLLMKPHILLGHHPQLSPVDLWILEFCWLLNSVYMLVHPPLTIRFRLSRYCSPSYLSCQVVDISTFCGFHFQSVHCLKSSEIFFDFLKSPQLWFGNLC